MTNILKTTFVATIAAVAFAPITAPAATHAPLSAAAADPAVTVDGSQIELSRRGRGADDGAGHDVGDDKGGRGRDGGKGRGRGADDGPNHD